MAEIFISLYSPANKDGWEKKEREGVRQFLNEEFSYTWNGFSVWDAGNGTVDCHYEAKIVLIPTEAAGKDKMLGKILKKNPFTLKEDIHRCFENELKKYLDDEFEEYCTCDDYYQPVVEDFEIDYRVNEWSKKYGFEVVLCEGGGNDSGYEPKFRRGWY